MASKLVLLCVLLFAAGALGNNGCEDRTTAAWCDAQCWVVNPYGTDFWIDQYIGCLDWWEECWCCKPKLHNSGSSYAAGGYGYGATPQYSYTCPDDPFCNDDCYYGWTGGTC